MVDMVTVLLPNAQSCYCISGENQVFLIPRTVDELGELRPLLSSGI